MEKTVVHSAATRPGATHLRCPWSRASSLRHPGGAPNRCSARLLGAARGEYGIAAEHMTDLRCVLITAPDGRLAWREWPALGSMAPAIWAAWKQPPTTCPARRALFNPRSAQNCSHAETSPQCPTLGTARVIGRHPSCRIAQARPAPATLDLLLPDLPSTTNPAQLAAGSGERTSPLGQRSRPTLRSTHRHQPHPRSAKSRLTDTCVTIATPPPSPHVAPQPLAASLPAEYHRRMHCSAVALRA
jgi:hypothetical protein